MTHKAYAPHRCRRLPSRHPPQRDRGRALENLLWLLLFPQWPLLLLRWLRLSQQRVLVAGPEVSQEDAIRRTLQYPPAKNLPAPEKS